MFWASLNFAILIPICSPLSFSRFKWIVFILLSCNICTLYHFFTHCVAERDSVQLRKKFQRYMSIFITVLIVGGHTHWLHPLAMSPVFILTMIIFSLLVLSQEIFRISVIILNRHTPVAILSPEMLHPLTAIISFPTGVTGMCVRVCVWIMGSLSEVLQHFNLLQKIHNVYMKLSTSKNTQAP